MSKQSLAGTVYATIILTACVGGAAVVGAEKDAQPRSDPFVGWYTVGILGESIQITRDGDAYRMTGTSGKYSVFKKKSEAVLEAEKLGTLTLGHLTFADSPNEKTVVLKASFCYEHVLLIKQSASAKD